jgi:hypothetical protein
MNGGKTFINTGNYLYSEIVSMNFNVAANSGGTMSLLDGAPDQDFSGFWGGAKYFWTGGNVDGYHYNIDGKATGLSPIMGMPPSFIGGPLRKGQSAIKLGKYLFNPNYLHTVVKPQVLQGAGDFIKVVGHNPDIGLKGTQIILNGAKNGPYVGKSFETGMSILDFIF